MLKSKDIFKYTKNTEVQIIVSKVSILFRTVKFQYYSQSYEGQ